MRLGAPSTLLDRGIRSSVKRASRAPDDGCPDRFTGGADRATLVSSKRPLTDAWTVSRMAPIAPPGLLADGMAWECFPKEMPYAKQGLPREPPPPSSRICSTPLDHLLSGHIHKVVGPTPPSRGIAPIDPETAANASRRERNDYDAIVMDSPGPCQTSVFSGG